MGKTIPGGLYLDTKKQPKDAEGRPLPSIDAFPASDKLRAANIFTPLQLEGMSAEDLSKLDGIGAVSARKIIKARDGDPGDGDSDAGDGDSDGDPGDGDE